MDAHDEESAPRHGPPPNESDGVDGSDGTHGADGADEAAGTDRADGGDRADGVGGSVAEEPAVSDAAAVPVPEVPPPVPPPPAQVGPPPSPSPEADLGVDRRGLAALLLPYRIGAALALALVTVAACVHLAMVFLHVAPSNTATKQHGRAVDDWVYPEFEQNWKLFAPNPLQQNIAVQVRAEVRTADGGHRTTGWYDLSAQDGADIDGNPLPSHTQQNELRRAWDFYVTSHDGENRPAGLRGDLSEDYLRRIVTLRLDRARPDGDDGPVEQIQVRSRTTNVPPPEWSQEKVSDKPVYRELPWWQVPADEAEEGDR
ncbi:DUF5819 family protein [Streptomyces sp. NPDC059786]|uniref:DUF5819 family protein n=1 Tax=Streptomyces sp. NPDC059786 TaxID=3346946 RepID=UPI00364C90FB